MKKLFLLATSLILTLNVAAQDFSAGLSVGLPVGDAADIFSLNLSLDVAALWEVSENLELGAVTGISYNLGDEFDLGEELGGVATFDDGVWLPIAAAARYEISEKFELGADLGYAIAVSPSDADGGLYYVGRASYDISDSLDIVLAYRGIAGDIHFVTLGLEFEF